MTLGKKVPLVVGWGLAILALSVVIYSYIFDAQANPEGFAGIKWASNIRDLSDMRQLAEDGDIKFYTKDGDIMKLEGVNVDKIVYGFYKGRFYNAMIYFSSPENFSALKDLFTKRHGLPYQPDESMKKFFWSVDVINLLVTYDDRSSQGRVSYFYQEIENEIEAQEKAKSE
ncbi:MAG: hypothetical protein AB2L11_06270 [Syntrophobacteraceae bacterium]